MLTTFNEVDMTNVMELRKRKKEQFMKDHDGTKLDLCHSLLKLCSSFEKVSRS